MIAASILMFALSQAPATQPPADAPLQSLPQEKLARYATLGIYPVHDAQPYLYGTAKLGEGWFLTRERMQLFLQTHEDLAAAKQRLAWLEPQAKDCPPMTPEMQANWQTTAQVALISGGVGVVVGVVATIWAASVLR